MPVSRLSTAKQNTWNDVICNLDIIKARRLSHVVSSLSLPIPTYFMSSSHVHTHGIESGYLVPFLLVALGLIFLWFKSADVFTFPTSETHTPFFPLFSVAND